MEKLIIDNGVIKNFVIILVCIFLLLSSFLRKIIVWGRQSELSVIVKKSMAYKFFIAFPLRTSTEALFKLFKFLC